jgi:ferredoxin
MRVEIDTTRCTGHMLCSLAAPEVFGFDDKAGQAIVLQGVVPAELHDAARKAERDCPERAVVVIEDDE